MVYVKSSYVGCEVLIHLCFNPLMMTQVCRNIYWGLHYTLCAYLSCEFVGVY
jgi:hypothetical protein